MNRAIVILLVLLGVLGTGCGRRTKEITSLQRKEAASLASEAEFAMTLRDLPRTQALLTKVVELCPDEAEHWSNLGSVRMRLGDRDGAKRAYESALGVYKDLAKREPKNAGACLQQVYMLALLGRVEDARKLVEKTQKKFPEDRDVRSFVESKQLERMLMDPSFKQVSL
jgi:Flp pilus assembly protein TadD